ncbi:MAG: YcaO-like family protein [Vicinamibacterales bacterium]
MATEWWTDLVSPKVGVIRSLSPQARGNDEPVPPYLHTATLSNFDFHTAAEKSERIAAGKGRTEAEAITSAIAEAIERYCAYHWDPFRTIVARWDAVRDRAIGPTDCVLYSDEQYRREDWRTVKWSEEQEISWIEGVELPSGKSVMLPAGLVFLVTPPPRAEDFFVPASSNGLAAGPTLTDAALGGLYELMERDALLITWMNRLPAVEIDLMRAGPAAATIARHYRRLSVDVRAFLMPSDLPAPVVMAVSFDPDPARPSQVIGMGCHLDPTIAVTKALYEMCQGRPSEARRFADNSPHGRLTRYEDVRTLDDHSAFASLPEQRSAFDFLSAGGRIAGTDELPNRSAGDAGRDLALIADALAALSCRVAYVDLTLSDILPFKIRVARALVTGLQPVHFGHGTERLGGRRLFELPQKLGFAERIRTIADLNPCPHPLA